MITMRQPSLVLHSCDVPGHKYEMWKSWLMPKGATASDVVYWIEYAAKRSPEQYLMNVIINCHGSPGFLHVGGSGIGFGTGSVAIFKPLKKVDIGTIWIIACEVAGSKSKGDNKGKLFCSQLAKSAGCRVIASEKTQHVDFFYEYFRSPYGTIDDYEGPTYEFSPAGGWKLWKGHSDKD